MREWRTTGLEVVAFFWWWTWQCWSCYLGWCLGSWGCFTCSASKTGLCCVWSSQWSCIGSTETWLKFDSLLNIILTNSVSIHLTSLHAFSSYLERKASLFTYVILKDWVFLLCLNKYPITNDCAQSFMPHHLISLYALCKTDLQFLSNPLDSQSEVLITHNQ